MHEDKRALLLQWLLWKTVLEQENWITTHQIQEIWRNSGVLMDARTITKNLQVVADQGKIETRQDTAKNRVIRNYWRKVQN